MLVTFRGQFLCSAFLIVLVVSIGRGRADDSSDDDSTESLVGQLSQIARNPEYVISELARRGAAAMPVMIKYMFDPDGSTRYGIAEACRRMGQRSVPFLLPIADNQDFGKQAQVISLLGYIRDKSSVPTIVRKASAPSEDVRCACVEALAAIRDRQAVIVLLHLADADPSASVRYEALRSLWTFETTAAEAIPELTRMVGVGRQKDITVEDQDTSSGEAAIALVSTGPKALESIRNLLRDRRLSLSRKVSLLRAIGLDAHQGTHRRPVAPLLVPDLIDCLRDANQEVRSYSYFASRTSAMKQQRQSQRWKKHFSASTRKNKCRSATRSYT
jgi:HEAT repeat protein